jgi:hypothetical protein
MRNFHKRHGLYCQLDTVDVRWPSACEAKNNSPLWGEPMTIVQLAITNRDYALALESLLRREEKYKVLIVNKPDSTIPGLVVLADSLLAEIDSSDADRIVVIASQQDTLHLQSLWSSGHRNLVLPGDSPEVALLSILAVHMRLVAKRSRRPNFRILKAEITRMQGNGLTGPFALTDTEIDEQVRDKSAGAFALDDSNGTVFQFNFVGRSDIDLNNQLHVYVGAYKRFKFIYCSSDRAAFEKECGLFHDFHPPDNMIHPRRPAGSNWTCPRCKLFG